MAVSIIVCFVLLQVMKAYVVQTIHVVSDVMSPSLGHGDYILVDKLSYRFRPPQKGDAVLITTAGMSNPGLKHNAKCVRRLAHIPGESVDLPTGRYLLAQGEYVVTADNVISNSANREFTLVPRRNILGQAFCIYFPPARVGAIPRAFPRGDN